MAQDRAQPPEEEWPTDTVAQVLEQRLDMDADDAHSTAETLRELFQGKLVIEDTEVESTERSFMWSLMMEGVVTVETQVRPRPEDGRRWRYFYWHLVPPERLLRDQEEADEEEATVYDKLPADAWARPESAQPEATA